MLWLRFVFNIQPNTEAEILSGLRKTYLDMTLVLVTHCMEVAASADEIVRLSGGRIQSSGDPAEVIGVSSQPAPSQGIYSDRKSVV